MVNVKTDERIKKMRELSNVYSDEIVCDKLGITQDQRRDLFKIYHAEKRQAKIEAIKILYEAGMTVETISILLMLSEGAVDEVLSEYYQQKSDD